MSQYKLIYFDTRSRGEIIRLVFAAAGVAFEDCRISKDEWAQLKPSLAGKSELDEVKVDIIVDSVEDVTKSFRQLLWKSEKDEAKQAQLKKIYTEDTLSTFLNNFENLLTANNNGDGYFVGDSLTWADLYFYVLLGRLELQFGLTNPFEKFPKLKALIDRIGSQPKIAEYIAKRPEASH